MSSQIWKQQLEQRRGNRTITNPMVRRAYNKKAIRQGRIQRRNTNGRYDYSENGQQRRGRDRGREYKENKDRQGPSKEKRVTKFSGDKLSSQLVRSQRLDAVEESLIQLTKMCPPCGPFL